MKQFRMSLLLRVEAVGDQGNARDAKGMAKKHLFFPLKILAENARALVSVPAAAVVVGYQPDESVVPNYIGASALLKKLLPEEWAEVGSNQLEALNLRAGKGGAARRQCGRGEEEMRWL
jgi:hypothetical protein